jgi:hypothetical protein
MFKTAKNAAGKYMHIGLVKLLLTSFYLCYRPLHKSGLLFELHCFVTNLYYFSQAFTLNARWMKTAYHMQNARLRPTAPPVPTLLEGVSARKAFLKMIMNAAVSTANHSSRSCVCRENMFYVEMRIFQYREVQHNAGQCTTAFLKPILKIMKPL